MILEGVSAVSFFNDIGRKISETGHEAVSRTKIMSETNKLNNSVNDCSGKIEALYREIGIFYMNKYGETPDPEISPKVSMIKELSENIEKMREEIIRINGFVKCPKCGKTLKNTFLFCDNCGERLRSPEPEVIRCAVCGAPMAENAAFCTKCGTPRNMPPQNFDRGYPNPQPMQNGSEFQQNPQPVQNEPEFQQNPQPMQNDTELQENPEVQKTQEPENISEPAENMSQEPVHQNFKLTEASDLPPTERMVLNTQKDENVLQKKVCPACGYEMDASNEFCLRCGEKL